MSRSETFGAAWSLIVASGLCILGISHAATAKPKSPPVAIVHEGRTLYRCDNPVVHDADTISDAVICLPWGAAIRGRSIRSDYDAWEVTKVRQTVKITDEEIVKGKKSASELSEILGEFTLYISEPERDIDPYDRIDAIWWVRAKDGTIPRLADVAKQRGWLRKGE